MAGRDMIVMSLREVRRLKAIQTVMDKQITQKVAGSMVGLSERQIRRLVKVIREHGDKRDYSRITRAAIEPEISRRAPREGVISL